MPDSDEVFSCFLPSSDTVRLCSLQGGLFTRFNSLGRRPNSDCAYEMAYYSELVQFFLLPIASYSCYILPFANSSFGSLLLLECQGSSRFDLKYCVEDAVPAKQNSVRDLAAGPGYAVDGAWVGLFWEAFDR